VNGQRTPLSPERAAKRAREREELRLIGLIADRGLAWINNSEEVYPSRMYDRTNHVIKLIQVKAKNPDLDLQQLHESSHFDFLHDFLGIWSSTTPGGHFNGHFLPRAMRD
jgi:hypothetical protein